MNINTSEICLHSIALKDELLTTPKYKLRIKN